MAVTCGPGWATWGRVNKLKNFPPETEVERLLFEILFWILNFFKNRMQMCLCLRGNSQISNNSQISP